MEKNKRNFLDLVSNETSKIHDLILWRKANREWLRKSGAIALKVLGSLREKNISQKTLAESMKLSPQYINKIVKGNENLSLETIAKLERALGIQLIEVVGISNKYVYEFINEQVPHIVKDTPKPQTIVANSGEVKPRTEYVESNGEKTFAMAA